MSSLIFILVMRLVLFLVLLMVLLLLILLVLLLLFLLVTETIGNIFDFKGRIHLRFVELDGSALSSFDQ